MSTEDAIQGMLTQPAADLPDLPDVLLDRLTDDVVRKIHPPEVIAKRYGLTTGQLITLLKVPHVQKMAKTKKAIWESDSSAQERVKALWAAGMEYGTASMVSLMMDTATTPANRIELAKLGAKLAGLEADKGGGGAAAAPFAVNIHFAGNRVERISTSAPVIEGEKS